MKKFDKKGFTIVELVIVIAVIAILAGVMIPTFSNLVEKANDSARQQTASAAYREAYAIAIADDGAVSADDGEIALDNGFTFKFTSEDDATVTVDPTANPKFKDYTVSVKDGVLEIKKTEAPADSE